MKTIASIETNPLVRLSNCMENLVALQAPYDECELLHGFKDVFSSSFNAYIRNQKPEIKWLDSMYCNDEKLKFFYMYSHDEETSRLRSFLAQELASNTNGYVGDIIDAIRKIYEGIQPELSFVFRFQSDNVSDLTSFFGVRIIISGSFEQKIIEAAKRLKQQYQDLANEPKSNEFADFSLSDYSKKHLDEDSTYYELDQCVRVEAKGGEGRCYAMFDKVDIADIRYFFILMAINRAMLDDGHWTMYQFSIPSFAGREIGRFSLATTHAVPPNTISSIKTVVNYVLTPFTQQLENLNVHRAHTKAAIGAIMSRNGSHNIGSHVLAALSHNVGTMPDDQVLYQYIQHRMDYIATATTERPAWSQPTMFVGTMMKYFLSQRHLLNFISRSEGLKAWEFQSDRAKSERGGRIKIHIRKVDTNGTLIYDFLNYSALDAPIDLSHDVSLAIPGGVVGQHAFFTIVENVIRNAAKHDWSTPPTNTACLKELPPQGVVNSSTGDLDVYIDFEDNPEKDHVSFAIWSRLSDVFDNVDSTGDHESSLQPADIRAILQANSDISRLPLHNRQQIELAKPFITEQGDLRRENWGLAEMKISAGYLQKANIEDIGGISDADARYKIIVPCCVDDGRANDANLKLEVKHLGYKFNVPKARQILFVVSQRPQALALDPALESGLCKNGIYVKTKEDISKAAVGNYAYMVMDTFPEGDEMRQLPFRVLAMRREDNNDVHKQVAGNLNNTATDDIRPVLNKAASCDEYLQEVIGHAGKDTNKIAEELIETVCECWIRYLRNIRKLQSCVPIYINTVGGKGGAGKSLVTDLDIVEYAFNEGIGSALKAFLAIGKNAENASVFVDCLTALQEGPDGNLLVFDRKRELELIKREKEEKDSRVKFDRENIIKRQLCAWLTEWRKTKTNSDVDDAINYLNGLSGKITDIESQIDILKKERLRAPDGSLESRIKQLKKDRLVAQHALEKETKIRPLVTYLLAYCEQVSGLISKYAETIATLPECFSKNAVGKYSWDTEWAGLHFWKDKVPEKVPLPGTPLESLSQIRYWRHETERKTGAGTGEPIDLYLEGLSGTQSYLNVLERFSQNDRFMQTRLVENALLRVLIIDERTRDFLEKHPAMFTTFDALGIHVANDKKVYAELEELEKNHEVPDASEAMTDDLVNLSPKVLFNMRRLRQGMDGALSQQELIDTVRKKFRDKYEILIIHQGIIDKWLPGTSHRKNIVAEFLASLEKVFRYVVITTGRGTPANIPATGRVLPFSTIQRTLFSQHPEKLILTDAIMNILPVKGGTDVRG